MPQDPYAAVSRWKSLALTGNLLEQMHVCRPVNPTNKISGITLNGAWRTSCHAMFVLGIRFKDEANGERVLL
jgi:hypothetical protein